MSRSQDRRPEDAVDGGTPRSGEDARLRSIIESTTDAILVIDRDDGSVRFANPAAENLFRRSRERLVGAPFGFPLVADGQSAEVDLDGERVAEMRAVELTWEGHPAWLASLRDVSARKEAEETARHLWLARVEREQAEKERARLLEVLERAPALVLTTRGERHACVFANPPARQLFGERELTGRPLAAGVAELPGQGLLEAFDAAYRDGHGHTLRELELRLATDTGSMVRRLDVTIEPLRGGEAITGLMCFAHDVTDQVQARRELEIAMERLRAEDRRKDQLMAALGHELRNPLAAIDGGLAVLERSAGEPEAQARTLEMMRRQVRRQANVLDGLLDISRVATGTLELRRSIVPLAGILDAALAHCSDRLGAHRELTVETPRDPIFVDADQRRLAQVVCHLLDNSIRYSPPGGPIRIEARREEGAVVLEITDQGAGIAEAMLDRIFEPFLQDAREGAAIGGLGIGLTLAKGLVELHGGSIAVRSPGPGGGSTFTVRLPLAEAPAPGGARTAAEAPPATARRVLVVDDNADAASTLAELLEMHGYVARAATSGQEALAIACRGSFDAVLLDLDLPDTTGYELAGRLRREAGLRDAPIIAVSGFGDEPARERSRRSGIDHHLVKPVEVQQIVRLLDASGS